MTKVHAFRGTKKKKCFKDTRRRLRNSCTCLHLIFCRPYRLVKKQMLRTKGSTGCFPILLSRTQHQRWACNTVTRGAELLMYSAFIFHEQTFSCSSHSSRLQLRSMIIGRQTDLLKRKQREGDNRHKQYSRPAVWCGKTGDVRTAACISLDPYLSLGTLTSLATITHNPLFLRTESNRSSYRPQAEYGLGETSDISKARLRIHVSREAIRCPPLLDKFQWPSLCPWVPRFDNLPPIALELGVTSCGEVF